MDLHDSRRGTSSPFTLDLSSRKRARNIVTRSGGIVRGKFPSRKNGALVHHEGCLELDSFFLFEAMPNVVGYQEQPAKGYYPDNGRIRRYTPDVALEMDAGHAIIVETKTAAALADPLLQSKLQQLERFFAGEGYPFRVLLDTEIRHQPRLNNLKWIYRRASMRRSTPQSQRAARLLLQPLLPGTISDVVAFLQPRGLNLFDLMLDGFVSYPLEAVIDTDSIVDFAEVAMPPWSETIFPIAPDLVRTHVREADHV